MDHDKHAASEFNWTGGDFSPSQRVQTGVAPDIQTGVVVARYQAEGAPGFIYYVQNDNAKSPAFWANPADLTAL